MRILKMKVTVCFFFLSLFLVPVISSADSTAITPGITWNKATVKNNLLIQSTNILTTNLSDPYTSIQLGVPLAIGNLSTVPVTSLHNSYKNHQVVGAINASFFQNGVPLYLVSQHQSLLRLGTVSNASNGYMYIPAAFGMTEQGKGLIDTLHLEFTIGHNGKVSKLDGYNRIRRKNESILYTGSNLTDTTNTNSSGMEIVVRKLNKPFDPGAHFGEKITGQVTDIRSVGSKSPLLIPKDGFIISAQGLKVKDIKDLQIGDSLSIKADVEAKWKTSQFIVASGPLLVQKGKVNMTIDSASTLALNRAPHSAVAIDKSGTRVFFVTVDGRQPGFSTGMSLKEFAEYLVQKGAYQALNLDGGGSTTMAIRVPGLANAKTVNRPSDGRDRKVSTILEVISSAPPSTPVKINVAQQNPGTLMVGAKTEIKINSILDRYNNVLKFKSNRLTFRVMGGIGTIKNGTFTATKPGIGQVEVKYENIKQQIPIKIVSSPSKIVVTPQKIKIGTKQSKQLTAKAYDQKGTLVMFNPSQLHIKTDKQIGVVGKNMTLIAASKKSTGNIMVSLGNKKTRIPVEVSSKPSKLSKIISMSFFNLSSFISNNLLDYFNHQENLVNKYAAIEISMRNMLKVM